MVVAMICLHVCWGLASLEVQFAFKLQLLIESEVEVVAFLIALDCLLVPSEARLIEKEFVKL
jgi:hypothetical protein